MTQALRHRSVDIHVCGDRVGPKQGSARTYRLTWIACRDYASIDNTPITAMESAMEFAMRHKIKIAVVAAGLAVALAFGLSAPIGSEPAKAANACTQTCQVRFQQCMKDSGDRNACTDELNSCRNQCFAGG